MEIRPIGNSDNTDVQTDRRTEGQTDRRTNTTKELGAFRDYANTHKTMLKYSKYSALSLVTEERPINLCDSVARHIFHVPNNKTSVGISALS